MPRGRHRRQFERTSALFTMMFALGRWLAPCLRPFGVDREHFLTLLATRLRMDMRRGSRAHGSGSMNPWQAGLWMMLLASLLQGVFATVLLVGSPDLHTGAFRVFVFLSVLTTVTLMGDHAGALFDTSDLQVLGPLPVTGRTVVAVRVTHLLIHFVVLIGAVGIAPCIGGIVAFGWWPFLPLFLGALVANTATCLVLAVLLMVVVLRSVSPQRARALLLTTQIACAVGMVVMFQMLAPMMRLAKEGSSTLQSAWAWLLPPAHPAALVALGSEPASATLLGQAALALLVPPLLLWLLASRSDSFQARMVAMASRDHDADVRPRRRWLRRFLPRHAEVIAGYDFAAALAARDRAFRTRAWPPVVMTWCFGALLVWQSMRRGREANHALACSGLYMLALLAPQVLKLARFSDDWAARSLFRSQPLQRPSNLVLGTTLALGGTFLLPAALLTFAIGIAWAGASQLPDFLFALLIALECSLLALQWNENRIPFTERFNASLVQSGFAQALLWGLLVSALAGGHALLRQDRSAFWIAIGGLALLVGLHAASIGAGLRLRRHVPVHWPDETREEARSGGERA